MSLAVPLGVMLVLQLLERLERAMLPPVRRSDVRMPDRSPSCAVKSVAGRVVAAEPVLHPVPDSARAA